MVGSPLRWPSPCCPQPALCVPGCAVPPVVSVLGFGADMGDLAFDEPVPGARLGATHVIGPSQAGIMPVPPGPEGISITGPGVYLLTVQPHARDVRVDSSPPLPGLPIDVPSGTTASRHLAVTVDAVPLSIHVLARNPQFAGTVDFQLSRIGVLTF